MVSKDQYIEMLRLELKQALMDCEKLKIENTELRSKLGLLCKETPLSIQEPNVHPIEKSFIISNNSSPEEKIVLYNSLFKGRKDVFALRWESKNGKSGYTPASKNEWKPEVCNKPSIKCSNCKSRELLPLTNQMIYDHLSGKQTIGIYPLLPDETSWFLAADFDKHTWKNDSASFVETCNRFNVPAYMERSRSGDGAHVWIFFSEPIPASISRKLGFFLLQYTTADGSTLDFESYDRLFPNQDTMPKGGFGNLIALPLQGSARKIGNTVFVDSSFQSYNDQWNFLSNLRKISRNLVEQIINGSPHDSFMPSSLKQEVHSLIQLPGSISVVQSNMVYISKQILPPTMIHQLRQLAVFHNPEFYKAQRLRLSTTGITNVIDCSTEYPQYFALPRGCYEEAIEIIKTQKTALHVKDDRFSGRPIECKFQGELRPLQAEAAKALLSYVTGILAATTAFGKTVLAAYLIAERKVNTLILVHRKQLVEQWKEKLISFLNLPIESIGVIGSGKNRTTGIIDIAIIQSVGYKGEIKDFIKEYGQVIVDECHHISAFGFERVLKEVKSKYVCGLTATPTRKDGLHPIISMQCGPIRFRADAKHLAAITPFDHIIIPRHTDFQLPAEQSDLPIQSIYSSLASDNQRNEMIFNDLLLALEAGRKPLLLTERVSHAELLANQLKGFAKNIILLHGGMGKKQLKNVMEKVSSLPENKERVLIATGKFIGEGFDDPRLDTLFLVLPISWSGTLQQYAGRLHRLHDMKKDVLIYDYVDSKVPLLEKMFTKRLKGYKTMAYEVKNIDELKNDVRSKQLRMF